MEVRTILGGGLSSNCFVMSDYVAKKLLVVDLGLNGRLTGYKLKKVLREATKNKQDEYSIEVFLTHCHIDHITGGNNLSDFKEILFSASEKAAAHINARDNVTMLSKYMAKISFTVEKIYKDSEEFNLGDAQFQVIYTPGHTDGSAVLYEKNSKSLFSGDVVFDSTCGRMDFPTGSQQDMIDSLTKLTDFDVENLYSGHGENMHSNVNANIRSVKRMVDFY